MSAVDFRAVYVQTCELASFPPNAELLLVLDAHAHDIPFTELSYCGTSGPLSRTGAHCLSVPLSQNLSIRVVELPQNKIEDEGCIAISSALTCRPAACLTHLDLSSNGLTHRSTGALCEFLMSSAAAHLSVLNLRSNLKLENGAGRIFRALCSNSVLESVDVTCCGITAEVAPQLAELLELNTGLKVLKLGQNRLGDRGVEQLKDALALNQTLRVLDVSQCMIGFSGARALLTAVQMNRTLIGLDLQFNNVSPAFFRGIEAALQRNQSVLIPKEDVLHSAKPSAAVSSPRTAFGPSAMQGMQTPPPFPPPSPPNAHAAVHSHPHRMASPVTTSPSSQSTGNASSSSSSSSGTTSAHTPSSPVNVSAFNELLKRHKKTIDRAESLLPASERGLLRDFLRFAQHAVHSLHDQRNAALSDASSALHDLQDQCQTLSTSLADRERTILELDSQCSQLQSAVEDLAAREQSLMTENAKLRQEVIDEREKRLDLLQQYMETSNLQGAGIIRYGSGSTAPANKKASISEVDLLKSENQLLIQALLEAQRKLASMHQES